MAVSWVSKPNDDWNVTGQPLIYVFQDLAETPDRFIVRVWESGTSSSEGTLIAKIYVSPGSNNKGVFDLSSLVDGRLQVPTITSNYTGDRFLMDDVLASPFSMSTTLEDNGQSWAARYTIKVGRLDTDGSEDLDTVNTTIYLTPGVRQPYEGLHPTFSQFYFDSTSSPDKGWLTTRGYREGSTRYIDIPMADEDRGIMALYSHSNMGITNFLYRMNYALKNAAGSTLATESDIISGTSTLSANYKGVVIGPSIMETNAVFGSDWDDTWDTCEIEPRNYTNQRLGATLVIKRDYRPCKNTPVQVAWTNWAGGWDILRFDGRAPKTISAQGKSYRRTPVNYEFTTSPAWHKSQPTQVNYHREATRSFQLNHNAFTASERALLEDLMRSRKVYYRYGTDDFYPCVVDDNSLVIEPAGSKMYQVSLRITQAQPIRC
jgi:hypothetical protein